MLRRAFSTRRSFRIDDGGHADWVGTRQDRTIQIRFSSVPESMLDALHVLDAVQAKFGRFRDYRLLRDSEVRSAYQAICWAAFESPDSLLAIPSQGTSLRVSLPPPFGRPDGGPGLQDILVPRPPIGRILTLSIKRSGPITYRHTATPPHRSRAMKAAIGHAFLEWGGFAPLDTHPTSPYVDPDRVLDSVNMRTALFKWSQILRAGNEVEWEPLAQPDAQVEKEVVDEPQESLKQSLEGLLQRRRDVD